jgi:hypothetical protein
MTLAVRHIVGMLLDHQPYENYVQNTYFDREHVLEFAVL